MITNRAKVLRMIRKQITKANRLVAEDKPRRNKRVRALLGIKYPLTPPHKKT